MTLSVEAIPFRDFFVELFGDRVYAVGGAVRDLLMGKKVEEVDLLVVRTPPDELVEKLRPFGKVSLVGKSFAVFKFHYKGKIIEIALPRRERKARPDSYSHKNFLVEADPNMPVEEDLKRRDFTVNSMALRLSDGLLVDPLNGRRDIERRLLRMTNPRAFADDPLRVLRAARFAAKLDFRIDPSVYLEAKKVRFDELARERVLEEMLKINLTERPDIGWREFLPLTVLEKLFPELYTLTFWIQDGEFHPEADQFGNHTIWPHILLTLMQAARLASKFSLTRTQRHALLFAALLHDVAKPKMSRWEWKNGRLTITSRGHDVEGARMAEQFCDRWGIYTLEGYPLRERIITLVRVHHRPGEIYAQREVVTKKAFNRLAKELEGEYILAVLLDVADRNARGQPPLQDLDEPGQWILNKFKEYQISEKTLKPLVYGRDLLAIGFKPGPKLGAVLKKLYEMQLDGVFETKEEGIKLAEKVCRELFGRDRV